MQKSRAEHKLGVLEMIRKASVARATAIHGECDLSEIRSQDVGSWPEHLEDGWS